MAPEVKLHSGDIPLKNVQFDRWSLIGIPEEDSFWSEGIYYTVETPKGESELMELDDIIELEDGNTVLEFKRPR